MLTEEEKAGSPGYNIDGMPKQVENGLDPIKALIFTAVFNGIAAVPLLFVIAKIGNNEHIMGEYKNGHLSNFFVRLACAVMALAALVLLYSFFRP